ncbi:MAG: transposase [Microcystis sp.]|uniref:transposase n=1 Tax=Microcystis sp. TaxID=1127 RepID=UPI0039199F3F
MLIATSNPTAGNGKTQSLLDPERAERLWLAMAVATLWMVMPGGEAENQSPEANLEKLPPQHTVFSKTLLLKPLRQLSCFLLGSITLVADLLKGLSIHLHRWSSFPSTPVDAFYYSPSS